MSLRQPRRPTSSRPTGAWAPPSSLDQIGRTGLRLFQPLGRVGFRRLRLLGLVRQLAAKNEMLDEMVGCGRDQDPRGEQRGLLQKLLPTDDDHTIPLATVRRARCSTVPGIMTAPEP